MLSYIFSTFDSIDGADITKRQFQSMTAAVAHKNESDAMFYEFFVEEDLDRGNVCNWAGVECENDTITGLSWVNYQGLDEVCFEWLPYTVRNVHIKYIAVSERFDTRTFPRSLEYLYMEFVTKPRAIIGSMDLCTLPEKMQELYLYHTLLTGKINLAHLPPTMRIVTLLHSGVRKFYVSNGNLPKALESIVIGEFKKKFQIFCIDGPTIDARVITSEHMGTSARLVRWTNRMQEFERRIIDREGILDDLYY